MENYVSATKYNERVIIKQRPITLTLPPESGMGAVRQEYVPQALHAVPSITREVTQPELRRSHTMTGELLDRDLWWLDNRALSAGIKINLLCPNGQTRREDVENLLKEGPRLKSGNVTMVRTPSRTRHLGTPRASKPPTLIITSKPKPQGPNTIHMDLLTENYLVNRQTFYPALTTPHSILRSPEKKPSSQRQKHVPQKQRPGDNRGYREVWNRERRKISLSAGHESSESRTQTRTPLLPDSRTPLLSDSRTQSRVTLLPVLSPRSPAPSQNWERPVSELSLPDERPASPMYKAGLRAASGERRIGWQQMEGVHRDWQMDSSGNQGGGKLANPSMTDPGPSTPPRLTPSDSSTHHTVEKTSANHQVHILNIGAGVSRQKSGKTYGNHLPGGSSNNAAYEKARELKMKEKINQANLSLSQYFCVSVGGDTTDKSPPEPKAAFEASILEVQGAVVRSNPKPKLKKREKGKRLVRFSLDTKIHEYTPSSPPQTEADPEEQVEGSLQL